MKNKIILSSLLIIAIIITGCKKYEDGPAFSLLSKKQRLIGEWEVTEFKINGIDAIGSIYVDLEMTFYADGDCEFDYWLSNDFGGSMNRTKGEWEFSGDKEEVEIDWNDYSIADDEIEITRLTRDEFQGEFSAGSDKITFEAEK